MWTEKMQALLGDQRECQVSLDKFYDQVWKLHSRGSFEDAYINLELRIRRGVLLPGTKLLTFDLVVDKWHSYIESMQRTRNGGKFTRSFQSWMDAQGYLESYQPPKRRNLFPGQ